MHWKKIYKNLKPDRSHQTQQIVSKLRLIKFQFMLSNWWEKIVACKLCTEEHKNTLVSHVTHCYTHK